MKPYFLIIVLLASKISFSQTDTSKLLVGTWDECMSLDRLDTNCTNPYTFFTLKSNGEFRRPGGICGGKSEEIVTTWVYRDNSIYIAAFKGWCIGMPAHGYYRIHFINDHLFYIVVDKSEENDGKPMYFIYRRRD